ncbi:MAG: branched-chain amino acid ABC transporter permease [Chloroflexi bacterium]|nr:branched-chain amino acid ABC transporter permease [Chloroflexota bacterium]
MSAEIIAQAVLSGLLLGAVYALIAAGLTLIFGLMEIVNFAHGEFLMLAMFGAFWLSTLYAVDPLFSMPLIALLLFALGVAVYYGMIRRVLRGPPLAQIFATFGLAVLLRGLAQFLWTPDFRLVQAPLSAGRLNVFGMFLGIPQIVASAGALLAFAALYLFLNRTETGQALLATAQDRQAARVMGIDTDRMFALGWGLGAGCVGVAGALLANFYYVFPDVGAVFALLAYVTVALGGFGSVGGALVAGVLVGVVEHLAGLLISSSLKYAVVFALYLAVVLIRPRGLFGKF